MLKESRAYLESALAARQASAIAFLLRRPGVTDEELWLGNHCHDDTGAIRRDVGPDSLFDLASLTKILGTVNLLFVAESESRITWNDPVRKYFAFPSPDTTLLDLMTHRSGLPAHLEFFRRYEKGDARYGDQRPLVSWISEAGLPTPGKQVYSDLGYMILGLLLESIYGKTLPELFQEKIAAKLKLESTGYVTLAHAPAPARLFGLLAPKERFVATESCPWRKKTLQGEVHDDNTWALGGYAGHAGLFSTARETARVFEHLWKQAKASPAFLARKVEAPGVFSFGFMTYPGLRPFPGPAFEGALGHTGFVGTSIWFHEASKTLAVTLSNRIHPARSDNRWIESRLEFHKALWQELGL